MFRQAAKSKPYSYYPSLELIPCLVLIFLFWFLTLLVAVPAFAQEEIKNESLPTLTEEKSSQAREHPSLEEQNRVVKRTNPGVRLSDQEQSSLSIIVITLLIIPTVFWGILYFTRKKPKKKK